VSDHFWLVEGRNLIIFDKVAANWSLHSIVWASNPVVESDRRIGCADVYTSQ
jgi:hypothetical protein